MTTYTYVLSYNPLATALTPSQVHAFIERNRDIKTWYLPFTGTYLLKSELPLVQLVDPFRRFFGDNAFVLTYGISNLIGGSLPPAIWDWINDKPTPALGSS